MCVCAETHVILAAHITTMPNAAAYPESSGAFRKRQNLSYNFVLLASLLENVRNVRHSILYFNISKFLWLCVCVRARARLCVLYIAWAFLYYSCYLIYWNIFYVYIYLCMFAIYCTKAHC